MYYYNSRKKPDLDRAVCMHHWQIIIDSIKLVLLYNCSILELHYNYIVYSTSCSS